MMTKIRRDRAMRAGPQRVCVKAVVFRCRRVMIRDSQVFRQREIVFVSRIPGGAGRREAFLFPATGLLASQRQLEDSHGLVVVSKRRANSLGQQLRLVVPLFTCVPPPVS